MSNEVITTKPDTNHPHYRLLKRLHNFYQANPAIAKQHAYDIEQLRQECATKQEKLQKDFDEEFNRLTGIYMLKEAEFLKANYPEQFGYGIIAALKDWLYKK